MVPTPEGGLSMKSPDTAPGPPRSEPASGMKESVRPRGALGTACPGSAGVPPANGTARPPLIDAGGTPADASPADIRPTGEWVARLRRRCGLTVLQFTARLGMSAVTVYRWEATSGRLNLHTRPLNTLTGLVPAVREGGGLIRKSSRGGRGNAGRNQPDPFDCGAHPRCADEPSVTGDEDRGQGLRQRDVDGVIRGRNGARQVP